MNDEPTQEEIARAEAVAARLSEALRARPALVKELVDLIREGLSATKSHWDGYQKKMVEAPDWSARLSFAKLAAAYMEGLPAQTVVTVGVDAGAKPDLVGLLKKSPNARRAVQRLLEQLGKPVEGSDQ